MYPVVFEFTRQVRHSRILLLLRPLLLVPHVLWVNVYAGIAALLWVASALTIIVTGRHPRAMWDILEGFFRYACKVNAYALNVSDTYPPFGGGSARPFPLRVSCRYPDTMGRAGTLFRPVLLAPHLIVSFFLGLCLLVLMPVVIVSVLLLGRMPRWQWGFIVTQLTYHSRVLAYALLLTDAYPPFNGVQPMAAAEYFHADHEAQEFELFEG